MTKEQLLSYVQAALLFTRSDDLEGARGISYCLGANDFHSVLVVSALALAVISSLQPSCSPATKSAAATRQRHGRT